MSGWTIHEGTAVALDRESIDTDQLIPARFLATPRAEGYAGFLLHDLRRDDDGAPLPAFPLNRHPEATVLVTRGNFGSGSSREAAVYALVDAGIRVVVAPSFADIFMANAVNNGLLPARVNGTEALIRALGAGSLPARADLAARTVAVGGRTMPFEIDPAAREKLVNGWDDIDLTLAHRDGIAAFRAARRAAAPWVFPADDRA